MAMAVAAARRWHGMAFGGLVPQSSEALRQRRSAQRPLRRPVVALAVVAAVALAVAAAAAWSSACLGFAGGSGRSFVGGRLSRRQRGWALPRRAAEGESKLDEFIAFAEKAEEEEVDAKVDSEYGELSPQDITMLSTRVDSAGDDVPEALKAVVKAVNVATDKRMVKAAKDLSDLLRSTGDIDDNIRKCLAGQDSPIPILSVLRMNIGGAIKEKKDQQVKALQYIEGKMQQELSREVPVANKLLSSLLLQPEKEVRVKLLNFALDPEKPDAVRAEELGTAVCGLVDDVKVQFKSVGSEAQKKSLELVRAVAMDAAKVLGQKQGPEAQAELMDQLQPLFDALSELT